ncbi:MAG: 50S ribosomal protein L30 [Candidatus Sumerlaeia bacterium]|nr:50S ribosomal protein L30 [Candidatus Sumerlaeia bacterium]
MSATKLRVTLKKSLISEIEPNRRTVEALGLRKINQTVEHADTPAIRGMIHKVDYMVEVEEIN